MAAPRRALVVGVALAVAVLAAAALVAGIVVLSQSGSGDPDTLGRPDPAPSSAPAGPGGPAGPGPGSPEPGVQPQFRSETSPLTAERLGSSHRAGCPVPVGDLRLVTVTYLDDEGRPQQGEIVVHADAAAGTVEVFRTLYDAGFPISRVATVEEFGSDDDRVMAANVTSGYNCRQKTGGTGFSEHAYGRAIDVNPIQNPYVRGSTVEPPAGRAYLDRSDVRPGMVLAGDVVVRAFAAIGWEWGGNFRQLRDYQHFSATGR